MRRWCQLSLMMSLEICPRVQKIVNTADPRLVSLERLAFKVGSWLASENLALLGRRLAA